MLKNILVIFLSTFTTSLISQNNEQTKQGGICFRIDDNKPMEKYQEYANVFNQYDLNFCFALNLGRVEFESADYIDGVKLLQSEGHELMDHTPEHRTSYFSTKFDPSSYSSLPGVDHIIGNKICLEYSEVITAKSTRNGFVNISGDNIISSTNEFDDFSSSEHYLYFPTLNPTKLVLIKEIVNAGSLKVADAWREYINLGNQNNIQYYSFTVSNIHLTINALNVLANETLKLADSFDLERPVSWIQPGISGSYIFPYIYMEEIKQSFGTNYDYVAAAVYPYTTEKTYKVFNEFDPNKEKQYGMQWGDFNIAEEPLQETKIIIADGIAKHHVLIGHSHFTNLLDGWDAYLERVESLLSWSLNNDIPVRTYKDWSNTLYDQTPNPYENIFPALNKDLDEDDSPDGYAKRNSTYEGEWIKDDGISESSNHSFSINKVGNICHVGRINSWEYNGLAGIEKGENDFVIWTKGASGNYIEVVFTIGANELIFKFPSENSEWTKYNLSQSINENNSLYIPENISMIDITVRCSNYSSGEVKVSGMSLMKKGIPLELKVFLEGSYNQNQEMNTDIISSIPQAQPYSSEPWGYDGDECLFESINSDIVDWVLVTLKNDVNSSSFVNRRAALLKKDGTIVEVNGVDPIELKVLPGQYYIQIDHRNHLKIISANTVNIIN